MCVLVAMSLFALLGVRYPTKLLPLLLLETAWKVLWLFVVALPKATAGDLELRPPQFSSTVHSWSSSRPSSLALRLAALHPREGRTLADHTTWSKAGRVTSGRARGRLAPRRALQLS